MATCERQHPRGRTLHLIDIENLAGGSAAGRDRVAAAVADYREAMAVAPDDHVVIGSGPTLACEAGLAWPGARLVVGRGIDGADRALLGTVDLAYTVSHYDRVVVGSGDHAFVPLVIDLRHESVPVVVVGRDGHVSRDLRRWATTRLMPSTADFALAS